MSKQRKQHEATEEPDFQLDDCELSDDDLDAVAGGAYVEPNIVRMEKPSTELHDTAMGFENPVIAKPKLIGK